MRQALRSNFLRAVFASAALASCAASRAIPIDFTAGEQQRGAEQLSVEIVPTDGYDTQRIIDLEGPSRHFYVLITNRSNEAIQLWKEWCSWGYFNLSFEARRKDGKVLVISKRDRGWDRNFPCPTTVPPGGHVVRDVALEPSIWENSPLSGGSGQATVGLRAVFEISEDPKTREFNVWTGKVWSAEDQYSIYWSCGKSACPR